MYASEQITLDTRRAVLAVPTQALSDSGTPTVWVVDSRDEIRPRTVSVGIQTSDWVQITTGLKLGDRVLMGDHSLMTAGMKVEPKLVAAANN